MKILRNLLFTLTALSVASLANAITYTDIDIDGKIDRGNHRPNYNGPDEREPNYILLAEEDNRDTRYVELRSWESTFDLLGAGFNSSAFTIISATVEFAFADDRGESREWEKFRIIVGGETLWANLEVNGEVDYNDHDSPNYDRYQTSLNAASLLDLQQDGIINYSVWTNQGDAYLKEAKIVVTGEYAKIPDSVTTGSLLAVVLFGVIAFRRKVHHS